MRGPPRPPERVVLDTNVLVSALLTPGRTASRVLDLVPARRLAPLLDARIVAEYWGVLTRPRFPFAPGDIEQLLEGMRQHGVFVAARPLPVDLPDRDDVAFAEVALAGGAHALVTGNARDFAPIAGLVRVRSPGECLREFEGET